MNGSEAQKVRLLDPLALKGYDLLFGAKSREDLLQQKDAIYISEGSGRILVAHADKPKSKFAQDWFRKSMGGSSPSCTN